MAFNPGFGGYKPGRYKPRSKKNASTKPRLGVVGHGKPKGNFGPSKPGFKKPPVAAKPKLGAPAPGTPPKPVVGQHAEPDSIYEGAVDRSKRREEYGLSQLGDQERSVRFDFGIDDPSNPNSRVNGLKNAFLARRKAASVNLASQGQLYSGAHERALDRTRREEEGARAQLRQAFNNAINSIGAEKAGIKFGSEEERAQAFEDWLSRAPEADVALDEEAAPEDAAAATAPSSQFSPPAAATGSGGGISSKKADGSIVGVGAPAAGRFTTVSKAKGRQARRAEQKRKALLQASRSQNAAKAKARSQAHAEAVARVQAKRTPVRRPKKGRR